MMMAERAKAYVMPLQGSHPSRVQHPEVTVDANKAADRATENSKSPEALRRGLWR
jgi:hypothetical protein